MSIQDILVPQTGDQFDADLLTDAAAKGLPITAWQSGQPVRTIFAIMADTFSALSGEISLAAQGGFLDYAASGTVTFTSATGETVTQKVTPDPSVPGENPNGVSGWLDLLAHSVYDVTRIGALNASGDEAIVNLTSNTYGPFAAGTYHATNPATSAGYNNQASLTIIPSPTLGTSITTVTNSSPIVVSTSTPHGLAGSEEVYVFGALGNTAANGFWDIVVTGASSFALVNSVGNGSYTGGAVAKKCQIATFQADIAGPTGTSARGTITQAVTSLSGVLLINSTSFVGSNWESNLQLAQRCRLKLQSLSPNGAKGAYEYFALTASVLLAAQVPPSLLSAPITRVLVQTSAVTGVVTVILANAGGDVPGVSNLPITAATNATPIAITTSAPHTLNTSDYVKISGVIGNSNANGTWQITVTGGSTFTLNTTFGNAAYGGGGIVEGGDLGLVDSIIQANCVPDDITAITQSSTGFAVAIQATVEVPLNQVSSYLANAQVLLATYFSIYPIGGIMGAVQYEDIMGILFSAGIVGNSLSYVQRIPVLLVNGGVVDVAYPSPAHVAELSPSPVLNVVGV